MGKTENEGARSLLKQRPLTFSTLYFFKTVSSITFISKKKDFTSGQRRGGRETVSTSKRSFDDKVPPKTAEYKTVFIR